MNIYSEYHTLSKSQSNKELIELVKKNDILGIEYLLTSKMVENHPNINHIDYFGVPALLYAIINRNLSIVQYLLTDPALKIHADINSIDYDDGFNALLLAISINSEEITEYLLLNPTFKNKIDIHYQARDRENALMLACRNGNLNIVKLLLERNINTENSQILDISKSQNMNAFLWACRSDNVELIKYLRTFSNYNSDFIFHKDSQNNSALHHAYYRKCHHTIEYLITDLNFDIYDQVNKNNSIFNIAYKSQDEQLITDLLIKYNFIVNEDIKEWIEDNKESPMYEVTQSILQQKYLNNTLTNNNHFHKTNKI